MCEACSVFAIHYKYMAEVLEKNIRNIDYIGYSTRTMCAVCEECSVFAIHYKYIVEGLRKTIRRTKIIDLSF